jgi:cytochrome oxidase assembly protein ShyY1
VPGLQLWRRHQQIIALVLMALVVALGCVLLSRWQYHRFQHKHAAKELVQRNYDSPAVPLAELVPDSRAPFDTDQQWRQVRASGRYDAGATILVRNRPHDSGEGNPTYGYEVLVPLVLEDGSALLVDRGWLPNGTSGSHPGEAPDAVPAPPSGTVEVVARLRPSEPQHGQRPPAGQVASINLDKLAGLTGYSLYPAYGGLVSEHPGAATSPTALQAPELDGGEGINASYAVQWLLFAALALGFPFWFVRRARRSADGSDGSLGSDRTAEPAPLVVKTPRKRIWDDEDE